MRTLEVLLHRRRIGTLTLLGGSQTVFAFDDAYIEDPGRPTLSLSFKEARGGLLTEVRPVQTRIPPFFSNLLPEGHLREYLAEKAGVHPDREFFLLEALGEDLPGAISVRAAEEPSRPATPSGGTVPAAGSPGDSALRFSLAGVQLKFSAIASASGGLTIPARGMGGSWIVKLPSTQHRSVPDNEFSMMQLARAIGIDVPRARLVPVESIEGLPEDIERLDGNAFAIERFDRPATATAVHIEDFAQVFGIFPNDKYRKASYRNIAEVLQAEIGPPAIEEFIRRLVFSALIGNGDMHLKNWSLRYPDGRSPALPPAYDLVSTVPYLPHDKAALNLYAPGTKDWSALSIEGLERLAAKARLRRGAVLEAARETVIRFDEAWGSGAGLDELPDFVGDAIDAHWRSLRIVGELGG